MKLFNDDFIRVQGKNFKAPEWPPPDYIRTDEGLFVLLRCSEITDEQREGMTNVCRGGEYGHFFGIIASDLITDVDLVPLNAVSLDELIR